MLGHARGGARIERANNDTESSGYVRASGALESHFEEPLPNSNLQRSDISGQGRSQTFGRGWGGKEGAIENIFF